MKIAMKMMQLLVIGVVCMTFSSCVTGGIRPSKNIVTKSVNVKSFSKLRVEGSLMVEYTQGAQIGVKLMCPDNLVEYVDIRNDGDVLVVKYEPTISVNWTSGDQMVKVCVTGPSVDALSLDGSGDIVVKGNLNVARLAVDLSGSGDIKLNGVKCHDGKESGDFAVQMNGSGDVEILGEVASKSFAAQLNGSGDVKVNKVVSYTAGAQMNGSGDMLIQDVLAETASMAMSGSGDMKVNGVRANDVKVSMNGSGDLVVNSIDAQTVEGMASGSGDIKLNGRCDVALLRASGSSEIEAHGLNAKSVSADEQDSSKISCNK